MSLRAQNCPINRDFVTVMTALLEHEPEQFEAKNFAQAGSWPTEQPHNRHNPRHKISTPLILVCATLIVLGICLRAWQLGRVPGVNGDEAWYGVQAQRFLDEYLYGKTLPAAERVDFRTPTGNIWNPFLMIPRLVLDATLAPSIWSLRLPALASGILALLVNWQLCRRAINQTTAWLTTALLAVLPVAVIYSRLGWDACQSILFCLHLFYLPWILHREAWSAARFALYYALALVAVLLVHPTNIFLLPLSLALLWPRISAAAKLELSLRSRAVLAMAAIGCAVCLGITRGAWAGVELNNFFSAVTLWSGDVIGLFDGATVYGSISFPAAELPAVRIWLLLLSVPTIVLLIWARYRGRIPLLSQRMHNLAGQYAVLFDGTGLALLCFLGVAGPAAIQPGYERYGLWLIAPVTLLIVLAYSTIARPARVAVTILAMVQVMLLLAGYWQYYQRRFEVPAAEQRLAHWTYRADNYGNWADMDRELLQSFDRTTRGWPRYILIDPADPQRWWFEWKWRYLAHDSRVGHSYQWIVLPFAEARTLSEKENHVWQMRSNPDSAKEKLSIRNLW